LAGVVVGKESNGFWYRKRKESEGGESRNEKMMVNLIVYKEKKKIGIKVELKPP
jgi:hypothetical protein